MTSPRSIHALQEARVVPSRKNRDKMVPEAPVQTSFALVRRNQKPGCRLEVAVFCVRRNHLDIKGTAGLAASVEQLPGEGGNHGRPQNIRDGWRRHWYQGTQA